MARPKKQHHEEEMSEAWLLPYSDLMTLLLAVFIVLFAVSQVDPAKAEAAAAAFQQNLIMSGGGGDTILPATSSPNNQIQTILPLEPNVSRSPNGDLISKTDKANFQNVEEQLRTYFGDEIITDGQNDDQQTQDGQTAEIAQTGIQTRIDERGLVITLSNSILFDSGSADLMPSTAEILTQIGSAISELDNYIRIEGHTDNIPISNPIYPSNWELSTARACSVARLLVENSPVDQGKIVAVGYADNKPIADNTTPEGQAENRRVDIIVLNSMYNALEEPLDEVQTVEDTAGMSAADVLDMSMVEPAAQVANNPIATPFATVAPEATPAPVSNQP